MLCAARPGATDCIDPGSPTNTSQVYAEVDRADEFITVQTLLALSVIAVTSILQWFIHPFAFKHQNFLEQWFLCSSAICVGLAYIYTHPPTRAAAVEYILATFLAGSVVGAGIFLLVLHRRHARELRRKLTRRRDLEGGLDWGEFSSVSSFDNTHEMPDSALETVSATEQNDGETEPGEVELPGELEPGESEPGEVEPEKGPVKGANRRWQRALAKIKTVEVQEVQVRESFDGVDIVHVDANDKPEPPDDVEDAALAAQVEAELAGLREQRTHRGSSSSG